ncbi:MAG: pantoate--beta-alanine ligase [Candidatus Firestonebacteria bacterium RIFOXYC2_FULL_39_67]|nr:MAG: pantoate--beta-alanine ligase [Candidatus Firestonebacteria bacterium RIFOXYD2_FULL_39_29]OGF53954.1 MAG: pantoate--beta-alanine ligase [Candidatus Firestonebacteria bacterium RIFOXYC2_FULL_39_67]
MKVISKIAEMTSFSKKQIAKGKVIGFVPTMGYLHEGHLSLVKQAKKECDIVIVSIFVNPTQFGPKEDLVAYPRDLERDLTLLEPIKADIVFHPEALDMYPSGFKTYVNIEDELTRRLCGAFRPVHFKGVTTIVAKLFNIVLPNNAYFGQKDAQQCAVIKKMVKDLNFPLKIIALPTVREKDGLAMSSRNIYLNPEERRSAPAIYASLLLAKKMIDKGELRAKKIIIAVKKELNTMKNAKIQYISVVNSENLEDLKTISGEVIIAVALKLGKTRLIDNIIISA